MKIVDSHINLDASHQLKDIQVTHAKHLSKMPFQLRLDKALAQQAPDRRTIQAREKELSLSFLNLILKQIKEKYQGNTTDNEALQPAANARRLQQVEVHTVQHRSEQTQFSALGQVTTADGRTINIELNVSMSQQYTQLKSAKVKLLDPLVIHYNGSAQDLNEVGDKFDINLDGLRDDLYFPKAGSGFLTLDKNDNGKIDNGAELFGPKTGQGFAELAEYDQDQNGWIDEADPIYQQLKIWHQDENGNKQVDSLEKLEVGAIYLGSIATPFSHFDNAQNLLGQVKQSGLFLKDDGTAGSIQEIEYNLA